MQIEEISKLKAEQNALRTTANGLEKEINSLEDKKKTITASKKAAIIEQGLTREVLEQLNDLETKDPDIVAIKKDIEDKKARKHDCAEKEFAIATEIAKILS